MPYIDFSTAFLMKVVPNFSEITDMILSACVTLLSTNHVKKSFMNAEAMYIFTVNASEPNT